MEGGRMKQTGWKEREGNKQNEKKKEGIDRLREKVGNIGLMIGGLGVKYFTLGY